MDLTPFIRWIVFAHVLGAFVFVAGHGVSMFVAFRLRSEPDRSRMAALLDLSGRSIGVAIVGMVVVLISGIVAGIALGSFGRGWIWVSLALFVVIGVAMTPIGSGHFAKVRRALGMRYRGLKSSDPDPAPASDAELAALLSGRQPEALLAIGGVGFLVILFLMYFRPF